MIFMKHVAVDNVYQKYKERYDELNQIDNKIKTLELELDVFYILSEKENCNNSFVEGKINQLKKELKVIRDYIGSGELRLELESLKKLMDVIKAQL